MTQDERMDIVDEAFAEVNAKRTPDELAAIERKALGALMDDINKGEHCADHENE